jgi:hypothetical protein
MNKEIKELDSKLDSRLDSQMVKNFMETSYRMLLEQEKCQMYFNRQLEDLLVKIDESIKLSKEALEKLKSLIK